MSQQPTALNYFAYNFIKIHRTLRMSPAMAAGITDRLWSVEDLVVLCALGSLRATEGGKSGVIMAHKAAAYEYWVVECHEDSALIPVRRAISMKRGYRFHGAPARFQAKCPTCGKTDDYESAEIRIENKIAFRLVPVRQLPRFSK